MGDPIQLTLPRDFKLTRTQQSLVGTGPSERQVQFGPLRWSSRLPLTLGLVQLLIRALGPRPFLRSLGAPARRILEKNADAGTLVVESENDSSLGGRPAMLLKARYSKSGKQLQLHGYFTFSRTKPVYLFLIAPGSDPMDWADPIAERIVWPANG
ncbi:MAG TPA: hypothetical protein VFL29_13280 [Candidatus Dormibacteraeota bacterium]|nr:hypothetical protein [Candidatus Dormibacteraeota bacterium]